MKTIGYFVPYFPTLSETFILREYLMLQRLGCPLAAAAYRPALEEQAQPQAAAAGRAFFYLRHRPPALTKLAALSGWLCHPRAMAGVPPELRAEVCDLMGYWRARNVGHVHVHFGNAGAEVPLAAARALGLPASLSLHAQDIFLTPAAELRRRLEQVIFAVTCTRFNADFLKQLAPAARIESLYHGLESPRPDTPPLFVFDTPPPPVRRETGLILAVGRLVANKGVDTLLRALALIPAATRAVIVGDGPERGPLETLARDLNLSDRVTFTGALPLTAIREWQLRATILAAPCRILPNADSDGIPNVIIEAMATGLPVIATPIRALGELIRDGGNGLLVPPDDEGALARAIAGLLADPARQATLAAGGRATVRDDFDLETNTARLLAWWADPARVENSCSAPAGEV